MLFLQDDYDIRNLFVRDVGAALHMCETAILEEESNTRAVQLLGMLYDRSYFQMIQDMYAENWFHNHKGKILHLEANMLASKDSGISRLAQQFVDSHVNSIFRDLESSETRNDAAFVIQNYARKVPTPSHEFITLFTELCGPDFRDYSKSVKESLLWTMTYLEDKVPEIVSLDFLLEELSNHNHSSMCMSALLRTLAGKSQETLGRSYANIMYGKLTQDIICNDRYGRHAALLSMALFTLSNIVVEQAVSDHFLEDTIVLERVKECVDHHNHQVRAQALWVILNAVVKTSRRISANLVEYLESQSAEGKLGRALRDECEIARQKI